MSDKYDNPIFYSFFIDPLLKSVQHKVLNYINEGSCIIDIACGTGSFSRILSKKCKMVTGIDLSPAMISYAEKRSKNEKIDNIDLINKDILKINTDERSSKFDYAVLSMAVHQFDEELRVRILEKANETAKKVFIIDYACPVKPFLTNKLINGIEYMAGKEHYTNFTSYNSENGIISILEKNKFNNIKTYDTGRDIFRIVSYSGRNQ